MTDIILIFYKSYKNGKKSQWNLLTKNFSSLAILPLRHKISNNCKFFKTFFYQLVLLNGNFAKFLNIWMDDDLVFLFYGFYISLKVQKKFKFKKSLQEKW